MTVVALETPVISDGNELQFIDKFILDGNIEF